MATNYPSSEQTFTDATTGTGASTDLITASNHNTIQDTIEALQTKLGLTSLASLSATAGHFSLPTSAGEPTGNPANGAGSMVWDNTNNKLYVNEDGSDSTWEEIGGGGGGSAFTTQLTVTMSSANAVAVFTNNGADIGGGLSDGKGIEISVPDSTNATKSPHFKVEENAFTQLQYWHGGPSGKVFEVVKEGGATVPFLAKNDGDCIIGARLGTNASTMKILTDGIGSVGKLETGGLGLGSGWAGAAVYGGITSSTDHDLYIYPNGTGTLVLGGSTTTESTNIVQSQIPMQIDINTDAYALSLTNPSEAKMISFGGVVTMTYGGGVLTTLAGAGGILKWYLPSGGGASSSQEALLGINGFELKSGTNFEVEGGLSSLTANDGSNAALKVDQTNAAGGWIDFIGTMGDSTKVVGTDAPADWVQVEINGTSYYLPAYAAS